MSCKYDIIDEGGRKRVRALRHFTVQGRDVCPMELGGYVYDDKTLSQDGNCWIFSGSLEYPGVRVMDEAIVDMGVNLPKSFARPKATIISGNSRIMGAISFETLLFEVAQTPAMFEQCGYTAAVGTVPVKMNATKRVGTPVPIFCGTAGKVAITSTAYEALIISLNEDGIVVSVSDWTVGGPAVTLTSTAPYILVLVRKVGETAITPADVTEAGITITQAVGSSVRIFNSSIVPVYTGAVADASNILQYVVSGTSASPTKSVVQNSYIRVECVFNNQNRFLANADFIKVNYNLALTGGVSHHLFGVFRNTNMNTPASVPAVNVVKRVFSVTDCPNFSFDTITFQDLAAMVASGKTFHFNRCNMPAGSAIIRYDDRVSVWDDIDFTKAMADLGKPLPAQPTVLMVSSNKQGYYRIFGIASQLHGALVESLSSISAAIFSTTGGSYDSVIYKDCVIKGLFGIEGCNVFGGTLGGASKITNTTETAMVIDGSFRIEGNAQVTDTPLKGAGYIGGNAELKNGVVEGYIYMDGNAKYIPAAVTNTPSIRHLIMRNNSSVLKVLDATNHHLKCELYDNAIIDAAVNTHSGRILMRDNSRIFGTGTSELVLAVGTLSLRDNANVGRPLTVYGDIELIGDFSSTSGSQTVYGRRTIANVSEIAAVELPPTKTTW